METITIREFLCGCEAELDDEGQLGDPISFCAEHDHRHGVGVYTCGECGFASFEFERLERHVYGKHLGVASP